MALTAVSLDDVKDRLGVTGSDDDATLTDLGEGLFAWMERETGRKLNGSGSVSYYVNGPGSPILWLHDPDPTSLTISERDSVTAKTFTEIGSVDYEVDGRKVHRIGTSSGISQTSVWPRGVRNLKVEYTAGYADGELPSDLRSLFLALMQALWNVREDLGIKSEEIGDYSVEYASVAQGVMVAGRSATDILFGYTNLAKH